MTALGFVLVCSVIVFAGSRLSGYGDRLAARYGWSGVWAGLVLLATVTSLPEVFAGASAVVVYDAPDLAVGGVLGSCMFNLFIVSILDGWSGGEPLTARIHRGHVLTVGFGVVLVGLAGIALAGPARALSFGWVGVLSPALLLLYLVAARASHSYELSHQTELPVPPTGTSRAADRELWSGWVVYALVVIAASVLVPGLAEQVVEQTGLDRSFVGNSLVALATSLPELVVAVAAVRIGAIDLAFGNILGSNLFNVALLGFLDVLYLDGPLLVAASPAHLVTVATIVIMNGVLVIAITMRAQARVLAGSWAAWAIFAAYVLALTLLGFA